MRLIAAGLVAAFALGACGGGGIEADAATEAARVRLPRQLLGLEVRAEEINTNLDDIDQPYVDSVAVFSLRQDDLLRASLQVNRFNAVARPEDDNFRRSIVATIGGSTPLEFRMQDTRVFVTTSADQTVFTWFEGKGMFVLAVQKDFEFSRTLLRRLVERDLGL